MILPTYPICAFNATLNRHMFSWSNAYSNGVININKAIYCVGKKSREEI